MSVYDKDGQELFILYGTDGAELSDAYDIDGNLIFSSQKRPLNVMSYNVQWFTGINSQTEMQQAIITNNNPSIIGFQELTKTGSMPSVGSAILGDYPNIIFSNHVNYLGLASKIALHDTTVADYENQDPEDISRYDETRAYVKTYFDFNGKTVCWINTHLAVITQEYIYLQFAELFALAETEEYVIITADFNTNFSSFYSDFYTNTYKQFVDAGYNLVNNSPTAGITKTYSNRTTASSLSDFTSNPDSIIVSGNIDIASVNFDTTKLSYLDGNTIDHIAVAATVLI